MDDIEKKQSEILSSKSLTYTLEILQSLEGSTSGLKCNHPNSSPETFSCTLAQFLPLMKMPFNNDSISKDALSLFYLYIESFHITKLEKVKIKKLFKLILETLLGFEIHDIEYNEAKMNEKVLMTKIHAIESEIFDKYFSLFSTQIEEQNSKEVEGEMDAAKKNEDPDNQKKNTDEDFEESVNESEDQQEIGIEMNFLEEDLSESSFHLS